MRLTISSEYVSIVFRLSDNDFKANESTYRLRGALPSGRTSFASEARRDGVSDSFDRHILSVWGARRDSANPH